MGAAVTNDTFTVRRQRIMLEVEAALRRKGGSEQADLTT